jgi:hypothetical protein
MQDFHEKMLKVDPEYLRQFETAESDYSAQQAAIESAEEIWITSTFGLYKYAIDHADAISVDQNGNLIFTDQDVRKSLLRQIDQSKDLQQKMMEARSAALDTQHKAQN